MRDEQTSRGPATAPRLPGPEAGGEAPGAELAAAEAPAAEIETEQRYLDTAYDRLDEMRRSALRVAEGYREVRRGGTHQARLERDAAAAHTRRRLAALEIGDNPLCFGRLDLRGDGAAEPGDAGPYYIGRLSVTDDDQNPLIVDWRAPVAEPFYRATPVEPMGVARRRHFHTRGRELVGIDDEVFDTEATVAAGHTVVGEAALLAALDRERTGRMRDIVATIQAEQDEAIRADLPGVLIVAGGPGTGKTAVALHRAAYLLYTHRRRLAARGVLLVGPNSIFLHYIDQVLPSLGEDEVQLATAARLKPRISVRAVDDDSVAAVKGDARMAKVIAGALSDRERPLPRDLVVTLDGHRLRLRTRDSARIVERARRRRGTHNERRPYVTRAVVDHLRDQYRRSIVRAYRHDTSGLDPATAPALFDAADADDDVVVDIPVAAALARG
ncbi:MAG TPA: UvrD-helicase domain-containing protein, partial [Acidimicrobiia bacterium]